jgi:single-stranded-DNA-specific exonuclease
MHLRLMVRRIGRSELTPTNIPFTAVWFNRTQSLPAKAKLAYRLVTDRYQGQARVQLMIEAHDEAAST